MRQFITRFRAVVVTIALAPLSAVAVAADAPPPVASGGAPAAVPAAASPKVEEPMQHLSFKNELIGGKKTWVPTNATVKAGSKVEITLINTLPDPHGFSAPGLTSDVIVGGKQTKTVIVEAAADKPGTYAYKCQLHPAHVGGTITVQ